MLCAHNAVFKSHTLIAEVLKVIERLTLTSNNDGDLTPKFASNVSRSATVNAVIS